MNKFGIVLLVLTPFLLGACATSKPATTSPATQAPAAATTSSASKTDKYRQVVENKARKSGARVTWVNLPDEDDLANKFNTETPAALNTN